MRLGMSSRKLGLCAGRCKRSYGHSIYMQYYHVLYFQTFRPAVANWAHVDELVDYTKKIIVNVKDSEGFQTAAFPGLVGFGEEKWADAEEDARRRKLILNVRKEGAYIGIVVISLVYVFRMIYCLFCHLLFLLLGESNADNPRRGWKPPLTKSADYFKFFSRVIETARHRVSSEELECCYDLTVNYTTFNVPPHSDEPHRDGPGNWIFNVSICGDGLVVFTVTNTVNALLLLLLRLILLLHTVRIKLRRNLARKASTWERMFGSHLAESSATALCMRYTQPHLYAGAYTHSPSGLSPLREAPKVGLGLKKKWPATYAW